MTLLSTLLFVLIVILCSISIAFSLDTIFGEKEMDEMDYLLTEDYL